MQGIDFNKLLDILLYHEKDPLLFNSSFFLFFFGSFLCVYVLTYQFYTFRVYLLTLFSLYFFYKTCGWFVGFVILAAIFDYNISHIIYKMTNKTNRQLLLICSIVINLGLLIYFKYTNFFIGIYNCFTINELTFLKIVLPVGISFYTFENLSYTVDVYKGEIKPVNKFIDYLFFLSFFPKLMMGPIVRAADFIPQINKQPFLNKKHVGEGLYLITAGIIKKVVISDYINANYVLNIFDAPATHTGLECLIAVYGYAMVIYCDFSGYSDMAIGMAKWMGFDININFLSPYQSANITEFWRRWHISLSSWLRDYVYIPLGGSRNGIGNTYINLMITMLVGGFWHGASWNFIFWGALHGGALAVEKFRLSFGRKQLIIIPFSTKLTKIIAQIITFHFVCFCWIFFKCNSFSDSWLVIHQIVGNFRIDVLLPFVTNYYPVLLMIVFALLLHNISNQFEGKFKSMMVKMPLPLKILYFFICLVIAIQFKQSDIIKPIYLQF